MTVRVDEALANLSMKNLPQDATRRCNPLWPTILVVLLLGGALAGGWTWYFLRSPGRDATDTALRGLQVFGVLPDFSLIERDARTVTRAHLMGKVWVANFIYTRCTDTCPLQSARMAALQRDFPGEPDLRFLSISVDPKRDTPAVLATYAARYEADRARWWFLTGDKPTIYALIQEGFHLSVEDPTERAAPAAPRHGSRQSPDGPRAATSSRPFDRFIARWLTPATAFAHSDSEFLAPPFLHSSWFVLGDRQARIRGYYRTEDEQPMIHLRRDIRILLSER
jgi:cytochrome oxidase Cu insertion factor (SCO1/SenC/PrrC family)